jgi:hypothetical protein
MGKNKGEKVSGERIYGRDGHEIGDEIFGLFVR